jgi:hypothetical protein
MPARMPVVCAVAEMRQRQPTAGQGGRGRRVAVGGGCVDRRMTTDPSTATSAATATTPPNALLSRCGRAQHAARRDERSDNAIRSQSRRLRAQQQNTRPARCTQLSGKNRRERTPIRQAQKRPIPTLAAGKVVAMRHDWLLMETLGKEPVVVAQGPQPRNLVPITAFLRRNPHLAAIRTAIAESIRTRASLASITAKTRPDNPHRAGGNVRRPHAWCARLERTARR